MLHEAVTPSPTPTPAESARLPVRQIPQQARVRRPRQRARLGLAPGAAAHPVIGFSEVQLTEPTVADYADTLAYLSAAIRLYRDTSAA
jgi:hypothetical protein